MDRTLSKPDDSIDNSMVPSGKYSDRISKGSQISQSNYEFLQKNDYITPPSYLRKNSVTSNDILIRNTNCPSIRVWIILILISLSITYSYFWYQNPGCPEVAAKTRFDISKFFLSSDTFVTSFAPVAVVMLEYSVIA